MDRKSMAAPITILKVEQGQGQYGCQPGGVQILFKESTTVQGSPNREYLRTFLEEQGFQVKEGDPVPDVPFLRLCVTKEKGQLMPDEMVALLRQNQELDLSRVNQPEGEPG
jgi:hypothetical protein